VSSQRMSISTFAHTIWISWDSLQIKRGPFFSISSQMHPQHSDSISGRG
jgi:hypothetical protein